MFSKASKSRPAVPSIIGADLTVTGDLSSDGEIHIEGRVDGDVRTHTLLIAEQAHVEGAITADSVVVRGTVRGQIEARTVSLAATARVTGDILHEDLAIERGAHLEGLCRHRPADGKMPEALPAPSSLAKGNGQGNGKGNGQDSDQMGLGDPESHDAEHSPAA